jgi:hypothetical protein
MQTRKMPEQKPKLDKVATQQRQKMVKAAAAAAIAGAGAILAWQLWPKTPTLDTSSGIYLLPQDTWMSATIATDNERWLKFQELGIPESRGVFEDKLGKIHNDFFTSYGYDYQRDIQPWIGKQVLIGWLGLESNSTKLKVSQQQLVAIIPIANPDLAKQALERYQTPSDANLVENSYKGLSIREVKRKNGTIVSTVVDNFLAIATDRGAIERVIDTAKNGNSLLKVPGYMKALTQIEIDRPFAQIYVNVPIASTVAAENSVVNLDGDKMAQNQAQQGIAANATLELEGLRWKGISWLKPNVKQKLIVENQSYNISKTLPNDTYLMISGGNLQRLWQDYSSSAANNPIAPIKPADLSKGLEKITGLDLESEILAWSKSEFGIAIVPKVDKVDSEFSAGLVLLQHTKDRSAADKSLARLDANVSKQHGFKITKAKLRDRDVTNWATPLDSAAATRGWLDGDIAFLTLGAPVASGFAPQPQQRLTDNPLFQLATKSSLGAHNGQFYIDVDRTINAGNLPMPSFSYEVAAGLKAIRAIGVTSAVADEYHNRFDLFVHLKKAPGIAKPALAPSPKPTKSPDTKASPTPSPAASAKPN